MEPRLRGAQGDPKRRGSVRQRQAQVVVQDDDGAVLGFQVAHPALQVVPIGGGRLVVGHGRDVDLGELDLDTATLDRPQLILGRR